MRPSLAKLIPWLFLIPPALVTLVAIATLLYARTRRGRALTHLRQGGDRVFQRRLKEAEEEFRKGMALLPEHAPLVGSLASLLVEEQRFEEAGPLLKRARELDPGDMRLVLLQGRCHQGSGDIDSALELWGSVSKQSDVYADALGLVSDEQERMGNLEDAAKSLEEAISNSSVHRARPYKQELRRIQSLIKDASSQ